MSLFSRIDRIRNGRGNDDREDDSVFAIPDLGKSGASAPLPPAPVESKNSGQPAAVPVTLPPREAAPPEATTPTAPANGAPQVAPVSAEPPATAAAAPRLSPLERLARRTEELEGEDDGALPDPVISDRPPMSLLAERLKAEPLADVAAPPSDEYSGEDDVPMPHSPFRRPSLLNRLSADAQNDAPLDDEAAAPVVREGTMVSKIAAREDGAPFNSVTLPPIEEEGDVEVPEAQIVPPPSAPITPASTGGTAFDRLMAARAKAEGQGASREGAPSLAERLAAMRSNAEANAQHASATTEPIETIGDINDAPVAETSPAEIADEATPAPEVAVAAPVNKVTFDPESSLEDVLPPEAEPTEETPVSEEPTLEAAQDEPAPLSEPIVAREEEAPVDYVDGAIAMPVSTLEAPDENSEVPTDYVEPDVEAPASEISETPSADESASAPPPFVAVEVPPAPVDEPVVAPPLPWEVDSAPEPEPFVAAMPEPESVPEVKVQTPSPAPKPEIPAPTGWRARLLPQSQPSVPAPAPVAAPESVRPEPQPQAQTPPPVPPPVSSATGSALWAQRLAGRNAIRDTPIAEAPMPAPAEVPAPVSMTGEALERAAGQLARTGGEGVASEAEARNRALYRQKHFIFDAVLGSLDSRTLQNPTRESVKTPVERAVESAIREFNLPLDNSDRSWMAEEFIREVTDLGPLVGLLDEVTVNKILVVGSTDVAVERLGRIERTGISFRDDDHLMSVVRRIADMTGGRIDAKVPLLDRPLPDGARIRAKIPPLAPQPTLTVEKSTGNPFTALKRQQADRGRENALPYSQLRERIQQRLLREFESNSAALSNQERLRGQVEEMIGLVIAEEKVVVSRAERASLVMDLLNEIVGLGPIEPLLNDPEVDEVMVNGPFQIYVERKGKLEVAPQRFRDNNHVMQVIERIVAPLGRRVDEKSPMVDGRLRDGSRFNAIIPPLALGGPTMTIRKFARDPFTMTDLINFGSMSREAAQFLQAAVEGKLNIIVSGGTGSGKTTTLNVLSSFIPASDRIVTIEDAAELQLRQEHVVRLETRPPNIEGAGEIGIRDLVRNSLRMRPDRIVVGECRGGEALDMLQAMNTGHDGSLTTAHSNGPRDTIKRLETMVMMAGFDLPIRAIREQIAMAVHLIVHQERMRDGKRRVTAVTELVGMEGDVVTMQDIFRFEQDRIDEEGRIIGTLAATGLRPQNYDNIIDHGVNLSMDLFQPRTMSGRDADLRSRLSEHRVGTR